MSARRRGWLAIVAGATLVASMQAHLPAAAAATTVTTTPATVNQTPDNSYPFGIGAAPEWRPFAGFIYKNLPAFDLKAGDGIAFDLTGVNDADIQVDIALTPTTANGGDSQAAPFTTVVTNSQTPLNPRGNATLGDYELRFTAQSPFSFPGGGLIVRVSNPSAGFAADATISSVIPTGITGNDASGFFVRRFFSDPDGAAPWTPLLGDDQDLLPVRFTIADTGQRAAALKKCKKKRSKKKRRKCRRRANQLPV